MLIYIKIINKLYALFFKVLCSRSFASYGRRTKILWPDAIEGASEIHLADNVLVAPHACLATKRITPSTPASLKIGSRTRIGRFNHIYATSSVIIEDDVLTANGVYISDNQHSYADPFTPIFQQPIIQLNDTVIGAGTWLGQNACVMGAKVGKNCVVGANSVVLTDIPDYSVVVGAPAKVIKKFDSKTGQWLNVT